MIDTPETAKPFYEYRSRPPTDEQLATAATMLAGGKSISAISRELKVTWKRAETITKSLDVMRAAERLRSTEIVPTALGQLANATSALLALVQEQNKRLGALESQMNKMNRTVRIKVVTIQKQRETIKNLREVEKDLRQQIRKRGLV